MKKLFLLNTRIRSSFQLSEMEGFHSKDYVVDKVLRKRPLGSVYKARRVSDGVLCAIKELDVRHMSEEEREDALEEIRVLTTVRNENVISYYDAFRGKNKLYTVMEYCDEPDLGRHIKTRAEHQKFFSEAQVWSYFIQILRGLVAVHSRGLIHRDVRSGNIIQLDSHAVKIGDIRVGKVLHEGPAATDIGNPQFVPPEVWQNKAYTFKSDVWAVGCVLYEMITLAVPFGGCSLPDMRTKVIEGTYQPIPTAFSTGLSNVLKLLLNPNQATRISARDILLHPTVQAHLHHAPPPAPMLRVRGSQDTKETGSMPALSLLPIEMKRLYPTLVVPGDKKEIFVQTTESKHAAYPPGNRHQAGLSSERPTAPPVRSRVAPILAPRAILSSRENDEMLADVNRSANEASKAKLPRVAMLGKVALKSPIETSATPQGLPSTPTVNMKHFKTAYVQSPKIDPDEFQTLNDRSDVASLISAPGTLKSKSSATPPRAVIPRREISTESVRSGGSSHSDDSLIRIRAPIDALDQYHTESATPVRENSLDSTRSLASSRSGDSVIRVRAPVDISDTSQANSLAHKADSVTPPSARVHSNGSAIVGGASITEFDPARATGVSDALQTSLAGDSVVTNEVAEGILDGPVPSQRLNDLTDKGHLPESSGREALDCLAHASRAARRKPVTSQTKAPAPTKNISGGRDGTARKTSVTNGIDVKALTDVVDKRSTNTRNRRLSFDGVRNEGPLTTDHSKTATSKREMSSGVRKVAPGSGVPTKNPTDSRTLAKPQKNGTEPSQSRRPPPSTGPLQPPVGARRKSQTGDILLQRSNSLGKDVKAFGGNSADSSMSGSASILARKKTSACTPTISPISQEGKQRDSLIGHGSNLGGAATKTQIPQDPIRSRRLSLDFRSKGREAEPMGRGLGHFNGVAI